MDVDLNEDINDHEFTESDLNAMIEDIETTNRIISEDKDIDLNSSPEEVFSEDKINPNEDAVFEKTEINDFSSVFSLLEFIRNLVKYCKKSGISEGLNLRSDVVTRFLSSYLMLLSVNKKLDIILQRLGSSTTSLAKNLGQKLNNCRNILRQLCDFFGLFHHLLNELMVESKPMLYFVLIGYYIIKTEICADKENDYPSIKSLKKLILALLEQKYKMNRLHYAATFLNPETKSFYFVETSKLPGIHEELFQFFKEIEVDLSESKKKRIIKTDSNFYDVNHYGNRIDNFLNYNKKNNCFATLVNKDNTTSTLMDKFLLRKEIDQGPALEKIPLEQEIRKYIQDNFICNQIDYWNNFEKKQNYPRLSTGFKMVIAIQPTETPSERLFSKTGLITRANRSSLSDKKIDQTTFINENS